MAEHKLLKRFIRYYRPHLKLFTLDLFCAFLIAALDLMFPLFSERFLGDFIINNNIQAIWVFGAILLGLYLIRTVAFYVMAYWGHLVGVNIEFDMRTDLFKHIQNLDAEYFDNTKTGQIMARLTNDLREITELAHHGPEDLFISIIEIIGTFILLFMRSWLLTLIIFVFVSVLIWFTVSMRTTMLKAFRSTRNEHAEINSVLENSISGIRLCKSFANEPYEFEKFAQNNSRYRKSYYRAYKVMAKYASGSNFLTDILSLVALVVGAFFVVKGFQGLTREELVTYLLFTSIFVAPIRRLVQFTQIFQSGFAGFMRFAEVMEIQPKITDSPNSKPLKNIKGKIQFNNVTFKYKDQTQPVLHNFNLTIPAGKTIALVGPSGVGKTTITHLIPRFYEVDQGDIFIDDHNIKDLTIDSLRSNIGFVQQDVIVFYGTIQDNIMYGKPEATDEEIIQAAKMANIHEFIISLPEGYDSMVGERGVKLSGGQKQRLAIARVFLRNPPILILDEATSSLDTVTELLIQEAILKLAKGRTTIIVAHRLSTIKKADEILVLTDEGISEHGTHEELLTKNGLYTNLYNAQFEGYLPDFIES
ncbi:MAG: ABC transporter ATP-binding protein [Promethearchaeota archaeon]